MSRRRAIWLWIFGESNSGWRMTGLIAGFNGLRILIESSDGGALIVALLFVIPGAIAFVASAKKPANAFNELLRYLLLAFFFALVNLGLFRASCHIWPRSSGCSAA
jgi:hypothetical protein